MRRGYLLVEMLTVIAIFTSLSIVFAGLFRTLLRDIPQVQKISQTNTTIRHVLAQIRDDVDSATGISLSGDESKSLLLQEKNCIVRYQLAGNKLFRTVSDNSGETKIWLLPYAVIDWRVRSKGGRGYGLEIQTVLEHTVDGRRQRNFAGSYIFFTGAPAATGRTQ